MKALKGAISAVDRIFDFLETYITAIALIVFTVVIFCNVVGRYVFQNSITWAEELSRYLNILLVFFALSAGIKSDSHIGVDVVETLLVPKRFHKWMDLIRFLITLVFCGITTWLGFELSMKIGRMKQTSPAMQIPMALPYMALPIGLFMASIRCLIRIIKLLIDPPAEAAEKEVPGL